MSRPPPLPPYSFGQPHLGVLVGAYLSDPNNPYYILNDTDISNIDPRIVARLRLIPNVSTVLDLHLNYRLGVALLQLIRHATVHDPTRPALGIGQITDADITELERLIPEDEGLVLRRRDTGLPEPDMAPIVAAAPAPLALLPAHIAREACKQGECLISREDFASLQPAERVITSCGHRFNKFNIEPWLRDHDTCPQCRAPCVINPTHDAEVAQLVGRNTLIPRHLNPTAISRAIRKQRIPSGLHHYYVCNRCAKVVANIPVPNKCPRCKKRNTFMGGSRKCNKKNSRRKSKKLIKRTNLTKRTKTIKRR